MNSICLRLATPADSDSILNIYRPYVENTVISFELEPPSPAAFRKRVEAISAAYPYLVLELDGTIAAYAYASSFKERPAYRFDVETSIYSVPEVQGRGVGKALYTALLALLEKLGYKTAYGLIAVPNEASVGLHRAFGFTEFGLSRRTGYKLGRWIDVVWLEKQLGEFDVPPREPLPLSALNPEEVRSMLLRAEKLIH